MIKPIPTEYGDNLVNAWERQFIEAEASGDPARVESVNRRYREFIEATRKLAADFRTATIGAIKPDAS